MAYTKFGEFVRILRIRHHEVMGDMAGVLGASLPFLSAVENGKSWRRRLKNPKRSTRFLPIRRAIPKGKPLCSSHVRLTTWTMKPL